MRGSRSSSRRRRARNKFQEVVNKAPQEELVKITSTETKYNFQIMNPVEATDNISVKMGTKSVRVGKQRIKVKCQIVTYTTELWVPKNRLKVKLNSNNKIAA